MAGCQNSIAKMEGHPAAPSGTGWRGAQSHLTWANDGDGTRNVVGDGRMCNVKVNLVPCFCFGVKEDIAGGGPVGQVGEMLHRGPRRVVAAGRSVQITANR